MNFKIKCELKLYFIHYYDALRDIKPNLESIFKLFLLIIKYKVHKRNS